MQSSAPARGAPSQWDSALGATEDMTPASPTAAKGNGVILQTKKAKTCVCLNGALARPCTFSVSGRMFWNIEAEQDRQGRRRILRRRYASHITVVLSTTAHSGPSECLCVCERDPSAHFAYLVPERIARRAASLLNAERAVRAAGVSVQPEVQA